MADIKGETVKKWSKIGYFWGPQVLRFFLNVNTDSQTIGWILKKKTLRGGFLITTVLYFSERTRASHEISGAKSMGLGGETGSYGALNRLGDIIIYLYISISLW